MLPFTSWGLCNHHRHQHGYTAGAPEARVEQASTVQEGNSCPVPWRGMLTQTLSLGLGSRDTIWRTSGAPGAIPMSTSHFPLGSAL